MRGAPMGFCLILLLVAALTSLAGCTATLTAQLEVDRPLAVTIDGERD